MDEQKIYRAALAAWGADAQTLMVFEEMSELQKELCKAARGKDNTEQIAEEIADVEIMLDSGVTEQTTDIFIESAYFNPTSVRKTV